MITIEPTTDEGTIHSILFHPQVMHRRSLSDGFETGNWALPTGLYLLARSNGTPMGLFLLHVQNPILLQAHTAFLPEFWGKPAAKAQTSGIKWLAEHTPFKRMFCLIPEFNASALGYVNRTGWSYEGQIKCAVLKDGLRMDEHIYGIEII
jgi:hypothetical protein